jgi:acyl-CoA thioesterase-2
VLAQIAAATWPHDRDDLSLRSLHATFVRAGTPGVPVEIEIRRTSDGRTFTTRRVEARQGDALLIDALLRFHVAESGPRVHDVLRDAPPEPESLRTFPEQLAPFAHLVPDWCDGFVPVDLRVAGEATAGGQVAWFRAAHLLGVDPVEHAAVAIYASDMTLLGTAPGAFGASWSDSGVALASLDHAIWFHEPFRADEWMLYRQRAVNSGAGRALVEGSMFDRHGRLVATVVQDGVMRLP